MVSAIPLAWAIGPSPAHAASITVTAAFDVTANDGVCSLREAIAAANTDAASGPAPGECAAGSGADTITLAAVTTYDVAPGANLPGISSDVTIVGNGSTIQSRALLRVLQVDAGATAEIRNLTLTHRHSTSGITGRGFLNRGTTTLRNVTVVDNSEVGHGGGIFNGDDIDLTAAELTIIDSTIEGNSNVTSAGDRSGGGIRNHGFATLTITGSTIRDNAADDDGGGISHVGAHLSVADSVIEGNAGRWGGGVHISPSNPTDDEIIDSTVTDNAATSTGGGIYVAGTTATIDGGTIRGNSAGSSGGGLSSRSSDTTITGAVIADNDGGSTGGGVEAHNGGLTIVDTVIEHNDVSRHGGGVARFSGVTEITSSTIRENVADATGSNWARGGGLFSVGDTTTVTASSITSNVARSAGGGAPFFASSNGGGVFADTSDVTIVDATIDGNTAEVTGTGGGFAVGGGVYQAGGTSVVRNVTISDNDATQPSGNTDGGGLAVDAGSADIVNTTVSGNSSDRRGGGISHRGGDVTITLTTVTQNTSGGTGGIAAFGNNLTATASIVAGNHGGEDLEGGVVTSGGFNVMGILDLGSTPFTGPGDITEVADPMLGPLTDNGGPTLTHRPLIGSPALDRLTGSIAVPVPLVDQRGVNRPQGAHRDAGAVERAVVFSSQVPERFADSRDEDTVDGEFRNTGRRAAGTVWEIDIAGRGTVPSNARTAILNVTVLDGSGPGFATVYPCTDDVPNASSNNYEPGSVEPNELIAKLSGEGTICVWTLTSAHVIVDVVGSATSVSPYVAVSPTRFADSRNEDTFDGQSRNTGIRGAGTTWEIPIAGRGPVPGSATAAAINLTVTEGTAPGFATVFPCGTLPLASSLNYGPGVTRPNELLTKLSDSGTICIYTLADVHAIVDVVGYLEPTLSYTPIVPTRYADSRNEDTFDGAQRNTGIRQGGTTWEIPIAGRGIVPASATTATLNLTVTEGVGPGFATVYPCGTLPLASSLNYGPGVTRPNEVVAKLSDTGTVCIYTLTDVHVIVDVVGHDS